MEILTPKPKAPEPPPPPPPSPPPLVSPPLAVNHPTASRPLPRDLLPVPRKDEAADAKSSAIVVPEQPAGPREPGPPGPPHGPIDLFPKSLGAIVGAPAPGAPIPKGPDRLFKDDRLEEKKEPRFEILPEKGGGFKCETKTFVAHIKPDGAVTFDNRFPIGFEKGGNFTFDITDLAMRGKKQDPYAAEKRRFLEFSEEMRDDLRKKALKESQAQALSTLADQLKEIWRSDRSAATRRHELYEKWADCAEEKDDYLGRKGRHTVEDFIRGHLPAGSSEAFTQEELSQIAAERHGLAAFDPYGSGTP